MANTKISQLPLYSGTAADLRWFVMNNSGETETFKFSGYTSGLINGTADDSIISAPWLSPNYGGAQSNGVGSTAIGTQAQANAAQSTAYGWNCKANNDVATALGVSATASGLSAIAIGNSLTASNSYSIGLGAESTSSGSQSVAVGRFANSGADNTIAIGSNSTATGNDGIAIGAGATHTGGIDGIAIGKSATATSNRSTAIGGTAVAGGAGTALGWGCSATGLAAAALGYFNSVPNQYALALGSSHNVSADFSTAIGGNNYMVGGTFNITFGWDIALSSGSYNTMIGGKTNTFTSTGSYNSIFNGSGNTISGSTSGTTMLGCFGRTANTNDTTYVENLRVFGSVKGQIGYGNYNNGSRATNYTIDWNNGNIQKVILTGSCVFSATNITDGTTYIFKVEQDNSGNRAATWSSGIFKFANGAPPTLSTGANDVDIFTFVAMDGLLYGVAQLNFG
jgi:hypothetical protein